MNYIKTKIYLSHIAKGDDRMLLVAKSSCDRKQLLDRLSKGFKHIELQLTKDFLDKNLNLEKYYQDILDPDWDILSVHMPLISGGQDIDLEFFSLPEYKEVFENTCELAEKCAEYYNHPVTIVIHSSFTLRMYELIPILFDYIKDLFSKIISPISTTLPAPIVMTRSSFSAIVNTKSLMAVKSGS